MKEKLEQIRQEALKRIQESTDPERLNEIKVAYLGKKGELTALLKSMKDLAAEEKPKFGQMVNDTRSAIEEVLEDTKKKLDNAALNEKLKKEGYRQAGGIEGRSFLHLRGRTGGIRQHARNPTRW